MPSSDKNTPSLFPVGAVTPVFDIFKEDGQKQPTSNTVSSTKRSAIVYQNKHLVDAEDGLEYVWTGEDGH